MGASSNAAPRLVTPNTVTIWLQVDSKVVSSIGLVMTLHWTGKLATHCTMVTNVSINFWMPH
jgi:hypothetical protein